MKRIFLLATLMLSWGLQARGESAFLACQVPSQNRPEKDSELGIHLLNKKLEYIKKNRKVTEDIIHCLELSPTWESPTPATCKKFENLIGNDILSKNYAFRMSQALSQRPISADTGRILNIFDYEAQVDLEMSRSSGLGVLDGQEPLIPGEREWTYKAFVSLWREFTTGYIAEMNVRMQDPRLSKYQKFDYKRRLDRLQQAVDSNDEEFLDKLSWSGDLAFKASAQEQLSNFRENHRLAWTSYLEEMRVLAYIGKAAPTPVDLKQAFFKFLENGRKASATFNWQLVQHRNGESMLDAGELLHGDPMLSEEVLQQHPEFCAFADSELSRYRHNQFVKTVFIGIPLAVGLVGVTIFAPPVISIPLMIGVDAYWISTTQIEMRYQRKLFYATLSRHKQVGRLSELENSEGDAYMATALAPLTVAAIHPSVLKSLVRAAKAKY